MCRFVSHVGEPMLLSDLLLTPENSLSTMRANGDGFGLGWYAPSISASPALFTSVFPAWNDRNLLRLATKIKSSVFFAHTRRATVGSVSQVNCHPFVHEQWMMMHNGHVSNFKCIKRHLCRILDDDYYHWIQGTTDSEHFFALFLQQARGHNLSSIQVIADVLEETFHVLHDLVKTYEEDTSDASYLNVCLTDGVRMVASRYVSDAKALPHRLYYACEPQQHRVLVSSRRLSKTRGTWKSVPPGHMVLVDKGGALSFRRVKKKG